MQRSFYVICLFSIFTLLGKGAFAQVTLAGWDVSTLPGGTGNYGPSPFTATTAGSNVTVGGLTRGSGVTTTGTATPRAWGGRGMNQTSQANAITGIDYLTFTITPSTGFTASLSNFNLSYRRSAAGATNGQLQYATDGVTFTDISALSYSSSSNSGATLASVSLTGITALQNIAAGTTITFRIVNWGASGVNGVWYIYDVANDTNPDMAVTGTTACAGTPAAGVATPTPAAICSSGTSTIVVAGAAAGNGISYQWSSSATGGPGSFSDISGATTLSYLTPTITATTYHKLTTTCSVSGLAGVATSTVTVNPQTPITGPATVCEGNTATLSNATGGGTWSSSNGAIATAGTSGIISGIAAGTANITYLLSTGCRSISTVTVAAAVPIVTGPATVCVNNTATLSNATSGGTWSSSNSAIATAGTSGIISGIAIGTANITYLLSAGCQSISTVTVAAAVTAITGLSSVCRYATITLANVTGGGTWSSINGTGLTSVGSTSGIVTGTGTRVDPMGISTIYYNTGPACRASKTVTVYQQPSAGFTGSQSVCSGSAVSIYNDRSYGVWSSSNNAIATVGSSTADYIANVTGVAAGTANISYTIGPACTSLFTVTVSPTPTAITGIAVLCKGTTVTLSNTVAGGTWSSSSPFIATIGSTNGALLGYSTPSGLPSGTATITYTTGPGCQSTKTVTVNQQPSAITGTFTGCAGTAATGYNDYSGGIWSSSNVAIATVGSTINDYIASVAGIAGGTANITYSIGAACSSVVAVTVYPSPTAITGIDILCKGTTVTLSNTVAGGTWTSSSPFIATVGSSNGVLYAYGTPSGAASGTATITYTTGPGCSATKTVTVYQQPSAISGSFTGCSGTSATFYNGRSFGVWSSSNTAVATVGSTTGDYIANVTGVDGGTATISYTIGATCTSITTVTVAALPTAITGIDVVCTGTTVTLSNTVAGGTWSSSSPLIASIGGATGIMYGNGTPSGSASGTATITYITGPACRVTKTVTVNQQPSAITGAFTGCAGSSGTLYNGRSYGVWSSSNNAVATVGSTTGDYVASVAGIAAGTAVISYTIGSACSSVFTLTVSAAPTTITGIDVICKGTTTTLSNTVPGGTWTSNSTRIATIGGANGILYGYGTAAGSASGTATITYITGPGCSSTKTVTVNQTPSAITGTFSGCAGISATLYNGYNGGIWSSSNTGVATVDSAASSATATLVGIGAGTSIITYSIGGSCNSSVTVTITPAPSAITGSAAVCKGATTTLSNSLAGGVWTSSSRVIAYVDAATGVVTGMATPPGIGGGNATITYTTSTGCRSTKTVTVYQQPHSIYGSTTVCAGATSTLYGDYNYGVWSSDNIASVTVVPDVDDYKGIITGIAAGTATVTYTIGGTCSATVVITTNSCGGRMAQTDSAAGTTTGDNTEVTTSTLDDYTYKGEGAVSVTSIYPNPTTGAFYIHASVAGTLHLVTADGRQVQTFELNQGETLINLPQQLAEGMYICQFAGIDGSTATLKIVYRH